MPARAIRLLTALAFVADLGSLPSAQDAPAQEQASAKRSTKELPLEPTRTISFETNEGSWLSLDVASDGKTIVFSVEQKVKGRTQLVEIGSAQTSSSGVATFAVPSRYLGGSGTTVTVSYGGDASFLSATTSVLVRR